MNAPVEDIVRQLSGRSSRRRYYLAGTVVAAGLIIAGGSYLALRKPPLPPMTTEHVTRGDLISKVSATGTIEAAIQVEIGAEISGTIKEVMVGFNSHVKKGDVLAKLNTDELEAEVAQERANLVDAEAGLLQAEATLEETRAKEHRVAALVGKGNSSIQDHETAVAALARATAGVASAKGKIALAKSTLDVSLTRLRKANIVAPIDGTVLDKLTEPGQTVAALYQAPKLFVLTTDLEHLTLKAKISEADIGVIAIGQMASFSVDAYPDRKFEGKLVEIRNAPRKNENVTTYDAILEVSNPDLLLRPGMTASSEIVTATHHDVLLVPNSALRFTPPGVNAPPRPENKEGQRKGFVWILGADGQPKSMLLTLGQNDGKHYEILDGLKDAGAEVLTGLKPTGGDIRL